MKGDMLFTNILVPYDGTASSKNAFDSALGLAKKHEAKISIFTCIPEHATFGFFKTKSDKKAIQLQKKQAKKQILNLKEKAVRIEVSITSKIMTSSSLPSHCIIKYAKNHDVDLIVMSTTRIRPSEKMYYHSTVENVFRNANCALLVIK